MKGCLKGTKPGKRNQNGKRSLFVMYLIILYHFILLENFLNFVSHFLLGKQFNLLPFPLLQISSFCVSVEDDDFHEGSDSSESSDDDDEMDFDDSGNDTFHEPEAKRRKVGRPKSQYFDCKSRNAQKEKIKPALEACKTISKEQDIPMVSLLGTFW